MVQASSDSLAPGVSFGSYVVRELIGRGGMASVYRAEHLLLNKPVALKVMDRALLATSGARQRFVLEGRAVAAIKHPNVVDITDVGVHEDVPFLVMELLTGEDLDAHLKRRGPLDEAATVRLALPIIAALNAAHASGVIHRDIKPSNIFLSQGADDQIVPKVLDFGISKVTSEGKSQELSLTPHHQVMGTPRYLPPEALQGARELGPASDQFSLGIVLYECVTGATPFAGDTLIALLNALSAGGFAPPRALAPDISVALDRVIMRALSAQPSERFATIRDMGRALLELGAERTQMVWGHSFKSPGESLRSVPHAELIGRVEAHAPTRSRRVVFGAAFISIGALASALASSFLQTGRGHTPAPAVVAKQETASLTALAGPVEPRVLPALPAAPVATDEKAKGQATAPNGASERIRPAGAGRSAGSRGARRLDQAAPVERRKNRVEPPAPRREPVVTETSGPREPAPTLAAKTEPAPNPLRRRGANHSPLLD